MIVGIGIGQDVAGAEDVGQHAAHGADRPRVTLKDVGAVMVEVEQDHGQEAAEGQNDLGPEGGKGDDRDGDLARDLDGGHGRRGFIRVEQAAHGHDKGLLDATGDFVLELGLGHDGPGIQHHDGLEITQILADHGQLGDGAVASRRVVLHEDGVAGVGGAVGQEAVEGAEVKLRPGQRRRGVIVDLDLGDGAIGVHRHGRLGLEVLHVAGEHGGRRGVLRARIADGGGPDVRGVDGDEHPVEVVRTAPAGGKGATADVGVAVRGRIGPGGLPVANLHEVGARVHDTMVVEVHGAGIEVGVVLGSRGRQRDAIDGPRDRGMVGDGLVDGDGELVLLHDVVAGQLRPVDRLVDGPEGALAGILGGNLDRGDGEVGRARAVEVVGLGIRGIEVVLLLGGDPAGLGGRRDQVRPNVHLLAGRHIDLSEFQQRTLEGGQKDAGEQGEHGDGQDDPVTPLGRRDGGEKGLAEVVVDEEHGGRGAVRTGHLEVRFETKDIEVDEGPEDDEDKGEDDRHVVVGERLDVGEVIGASEIDDAGMVPTVAA